MENRLYSKNQNDLLPLKKSGQNILVIGALANDKTSPLGNWRLAADENQLYHY
jgi:beta-glucosidase